MQTGLTKRQKQAIKTKETLFKTAVELFHDKGYENVTVEEIANTVGVAKGSFYTYYKSKSDIVIEEFGNIDDFYRKYQRNLARYDTGTKKLLAFTRAQMRYVRDTVGLKLLKLLYASNITVTDNENILIDTKRFLHQLMTEIISFGQKNGEFRTSPDPEQLALLVNRSIRSVFLDWAISDDGFDLVTEGVRFCEIIVIPALLKKD